MINFWKRFGAKTAPPQESKTPPPTDAEQVTVLQAQLELRDRDVARLIAERARLTEDLRRANNAVSRVTNQLRQEQRFVKMMKEQRGRR